MERAAEGDDLVAILLALGPEVVTRRLDGALDGFGAGIGEEARIGEGVLGEPLAKTLLLGDDEGVGGVPDLVGRSLQRGDHVRMVMAECIDGDAAVKIEILGAILRDQSRALAPLEREFGPGIGRIDRGHDVTLLREKGRSVADAPQKPKTRHVAAARYTGSICLPRSSKSTFRGQVADMTQVPKFVPSSCVIPVKTRADS